MSDKIEKHLKTIAEEMALIRTEMQYHNDMLFLNQEENKRPEDTKERAPIAEQLNNMFR